MAQTDIDALRPVAYAAARTVPVEAYAAIGAIKQDFDDKQVALGDAVKVPIAPVRTPGNYTPGKAAPTADAAAASSLSVAITAIRSVDFELTGEQEQSLQNSGVQAPFVADLLAQGMRALRNEMEEACVNAIKSGAGRAIGAATTTPFASNLDLIPEARKILLDNGAPLADPQLIFDSAAGLNLRKLSVFQQAHIAGSDNERRSGVFMPQFGFTLAESAGIKQHEKGAGTGYGVDLTEGYGVGATTIHLDDGTVNTTGVKAGDVVTFAGDTTKYVVNSGTTEAEADILLGEPGLAATLADEVAMTIGASYTPNLAFERSAVVGIVRVPFFPDAPQHRKLVVSDMAGVPYLFVESLEFGQRTWSLITAYGFKVVDPRYVVTVMG
jgi:hypothetical protein